MIKTKFTLFVTLTFVIGVLLGGLLTTYTNLGEMGRAFITGRPFRDVPVMSLPKGEEGDSCTATPQCRDGLVCSDGTCQDEGGGGEGGGHEGDEHYQGQDDYGGE